MLNFLTLASELKLAIMQCLPVKDLLNLASTNRALFHLSHDQWFMKNRLQTIDVPSHIRPNPFDYAHYCYSRVHRFRQEILFLQTHKQDILKFIGNTPTQSLYLTNLLRRIQQEVGHLEREGDERYINKIDGMLNSLNARIINKQVTRQTGHHLELSCITRLPQSLLTQRIDYFANLRGLGLKDNFLETLPEGIAFCESLSSLNLYNNPITHLPANMGKLQSLEHVYMSNGCLKELPPAFYQLTRLRWIALENMHLTEISPEIKNLTNLDWLYLRDNALTILPKELADLPRLREFYVEKNALRYDQPSEIYQLFKKLRMQLSHVFIQQDAKKAKLLHGVQDCESISMVKQSAQLSYYHLRHQNAKTAMLSELDLAVTHLADGVRELKLY